jgi:RNA polymerase I-specific transcription initiation factor RRN6
MSDPFFVYVPSKTNANGLKTIRYEAPIKQILFKEVERQVYLSKRVTLDHCPRFMKLFLVDSTMAVHEYLYSKPSGLSSAEELKLGREALLLRAVSLLPNKKKRKGDRETSVEPSDNDDIDHFSKMPFHLSKPIETRPARISVDFTKIYTLLSSSDFSHSVRPSASRPEYQSFRDYVEHLITAVVNSAEEGPSFVHTM